MGIVRPDGHFVATRNYLGVLTSGELLVPPRARIADHFRRDVNPRALEPFRTSTAWSR